MQQTLAVTFFVLICVLGAAAQFNGKSQLHDNVYSMRARVYLHRASVKGAPPLFHVCNCTLFSRHVQLQ